VATDDQRSMSVEYWTATPASRAAAATADSTSGHHCIFFPDRTRPKSTSPVGRRPPSSNASVPPVRISLAGHGRRRAKASKKRARSRLPSAFRTPSPSEEVFGGPFEDQPQQGRIHLDLRRRPTAATARRADHLEAIPHACRHCVRECVDMAAAATQAPATPPRAPLPPA